MTPEECHDRAREAKRLAADLWERELLFKIPDRWRLIEAHKVARKPPNTPKLIVVVGKSVTD
jgi:hypothetical protein